MCYRHGTCTNQFRLQTGILHRKFGSLVLRESSKLYEKSAVCHMAIQNYSSNYMNICSIITIITIKIIIRYCLFAWHSREQVMNNIKIYFSAKCIDYMRKYLTLHTTHKKHLFYEELNSTWTEYSLNPILFLWHSSPIMLASLPYHTVLIL